MNEQASPGTSDDRTVEDVDRHIKEANAGANPIQRAIEALERHTLEYGHSDDTKAALASLRALQRVGLPPLLTDEKVRELRSAHGWAKDTIRAIESEVRTAIAAAGGGVPQGSVPIDPVHWCIQWIRDNYQDHPTIDGLCAAMLASSPQPEAAPAVAQVPQIDALWGLFNEHKTPMKTRDAVIASLAGALRPEASDSSQLPQEWRETIQGAIDELPYQHHLIPRLTAMLAAPEAPAQAELTGCSCRWDKDDNRVQTCARHQGWLDVVHEWAARAKDAEWKLTLALEAPPQAASAEDGKVYKDIADRYFRDTQAAQSAGEVENKARTMHELSTVERDEAIRAFEAAHGDRFAAGFANDRAWVEGYAHARAALSHKEQP